LTDELSPEQEAAVRHLLAEARHDGPVPDEVAARLDEALDRLVADEGADDLEIFEDPKPAPVTALAGVRQRRRTAGRLLLAAAAVVVGGVAVGQVVGDSTMDADSGTAADTAADAPREGSGGDAQVDEQNSGGGTSEPESAPEPAASPLDEAQLLDQVQAPVSLTSDRFAADVRRELSRNSAVLTQAASADFDGVRAYLAKDSDFVCSSGAYGEGTTLPAFYDGEEAVLVLRRPRAGIQRVDLLACGTAVELNSVDLPAP
jgi:hypothetical protein